MAVTRYVKIGEEPAYSTEPATYAATIDPESADIESEDDDKLIYEGISGLDRITGLGVYSTSGSISMPFDDQVSPWFWKWALGGYQVTGAADGAGGTTAPYTHIFSPEKGALMTSFSARIGKDIFEHRFLGNVVESLELEIEDEWASMTVNTIGARDQRGELDPAPAFNEGNIFTAPMAALSKDGTDVSPMIQSLGFTLETGANVEDSQGFGSRFPTRAFQGSMVATMELTLAFDTINELQEFWGDVDGPSTTNIQEFAYTIHLGENIDIIMPRLIYTASSQPVEGRDHITQTVTARALYDDAAQEGPVLFSVTNDTASY